ncbi:MAG TPA: 4'-phosphopantetheinyl transferase superfamily protein [Actinophytocola sp.]|uniref:4'-phosphopantetheinyl transferase family protein n=1 Tax=Actinophytocola sp. TaxID=1872138 RepID=UPI002DB9B253|nr:4'-phosphopantetheinyl transferase superfamily protein [Actinophytocola sp.]HEU5475409.1 4'-phosphopantetheinyl transferase superfamily protein [Actinophytocola sp.]
MGSRCEVWWAQPAVETPRLLGLLDGVERDRHAAYHRAVDQARFLAGRVVGKALLAARLGLEPGQVVLDSTCADCGRTHGKPRVVRPESFPPDRPLPEMSISHSGDRIAVAVTDGEPVGVDVEQERDVQVEDLVRMTLSVDELPVFAGVPSADRDAAFFTIWSRKEAVLKATGRGLSIAMTKVTVSPWDAPPRLLASRSSEVDVAALRMAQLDAGSGYRACVAVLAGPNFPADGWVSEHDAGPLVAGLS